MPGVHKNKTIAFRPDEWERIIIEEKAVLSGMNKKDFIAKSCIYSNICVVGSKVNIKKILDEIQEMKYSLTEISSSISVGDFPLSAECFMEMSLRYISACSIIIDILDGAAYLFDKKPPHRGSVLEREEHLRQLFESIENPVENGTLIQDGSILGQKKCDGGDETQ